MHGAAAALKPFFLLAAIAFAVGFFGVLAFGRPAPVATLAVETPQAAVTSGPASDDWNLPKHI